MPGTPGIGEINAVSHGADPILIADAFGRLLTGTWEKTDDGEFTASFKQPRSRRIAWRSHERVIESKGGTRPVPIRLRFPQELAHGQDEEQVIQVCLRGLSEAANKLGSVSTAGLSVYVYPDLGSIASLTGQRGHGHAVVEARVLHVVRSDPAGGGGFEKLLTHEGTHVLAYDTWGAAGTPLFGEGLAVWAAGGYAGVALADWKRRTEKPVPSIVELLGKKFRDLPENRSYPLAGLLVQVAVERLGIRKVREHLYGATASTWESACQAAGTSADALQDAFQGSLSL